MIHGFNDSLVKHRANQISVPQESFWGKHKVKVVVVVGCIVTAVALAVLFWPASFAGIGALAVTYGISLATLPLGIKIGILLATGGLSALTIIIVTSDKNNRLKQQIAYNQVLDGASTLRKSREGIEPQAFTGGGGYGP